MMSGMLNNSALNRSIAGFIVLCLTVLTSCKDDEVQEVAAVAIQIPQSLQQCSTEFHSGKNLSDRCIEYDLASDHFVPGGVKSLAYVYLNGDGVRLRAAPSVGGAVLQTLPISSKVALLYRDPGRQEVQNRVGHWIFVYVQSSTPFASEETERYGWIFDAYISRRSDFSTAGNHQSLTYCAFISIDGSVCIQMQRGVGRLLTWQKEEGVIAKPAQFASHGNLILVDAGEDDPYLLIRKQDGLYSEIDLDGQPHDPEVQRFIEKEQSRP